MELTKNWLVVIKIKVELVLRYNQKLVVATCTFDILEVVGGEYAILNWSITTKSSSTKYLFRDFYVHSSVPNVFPDLFSHMYTLFCSV